MAKKSTNKSWIYERKSMQEQFNSIMGYRIPIRDVPEDSKAIAYTTTEPAIYIKENSPITEGLPDHKARAARFGLFAHEMAHQQFTDFDSIKEESDMLEEWERPIFNTIVNITEDPAVENMAPLFIGGYLLQSLKYAISRAYETSGNINLIEDPFSQVLAAMVQFGDMGPIKGHFTNTQAKKAFFKVCPIMQDIMEDGDPKSRVEKSLEIFEILRPLWEEQAKAAYESGEDAMKALEELMYELGKGFTDGSGDGEHLDPEEIADSADLSKGAMRTMTFKKLEDMDEEERAKYDEAKKETEEILDSGESESEDDELRPYSSDTGEEVYSDEEVDLSTPGDYDPTEFEMDVEGLDFLDRLVQAEIEMDATKEAPSREGDIPDFKSIEKKYKLRDYTCVNRFPNITNHETAEMAYDKIVKKNLNHINTCYKKLKNLFAEESEETVYRSSGKLDIGRTMSDTVTSKLFTKTLDPKDRSNMAVFLLIDESGSMNGSRIERAKEAGINLGEIFAKLGVPCYTMGFTADTAGAQAVNDHFTDWSNRKEDRIKLTSIHAQAQNFDGYSIRYASSILAMRPEPHKILIVISDGQPACYEYDRASGYSDTKDAIREARNDGQIVLGVAIGADVDVLQKMYGNDFIFITTGDDLFGGIMKKFTSMVKKW